MPPSASPIFTQRRVLKVDKWTSGQPLYQDYQVNHGKVCGRHTPPPSYQFSARRLGLNAGGQPLYQLYQDYQVFR